MRSIIIIAVILIIIVSASSLAAGLVQAAIGTVIPLSGYSSGQTVYLFLTGPNLATNGVALDDINRPADTGGATQVDVDSDGHWSYKWNTASSAGRLDAGMYTVWVADGPADLSHLSDVNYNTITVVLSAPTITASISTQLGQSQSPPGFMNLTSVPSGASVVINDAYRGATPLTVTDLTPDVYNVTFSKFGYEKLSTPVTTEAGSETDVNAILVPAVGSLSVNTSPAGAQLAVDGISAGISPVTLTNITSGGHILTVSKNGFVTQNLSFQVTTNQETQLQVALTAVPLPAATTTKAAAGLVPSSIFACGLTVLFVALRRKPTSK